MKNNTRFIISQEPHHVKETTPAVNFFSNFTRRQINWGGRVTLKTADGRLAELKQPMGTLRFL